MKSVRLVVTYILVCVFLLVSISSTAVQGSGPRDSSFLYFPLLYNESGYKMVGPSGGNIENLVIDPLNTDIMYTGSWGSGVYKSVDEGANWSISSNGLENPYVYCLVIDQNNPLILYAGTYGDGVYKSIDGGINWTHWGINPGAGTLYQFAYDSLNNKLFVCGDAANHTIFYSINFGSNWYSIASPIQIGGGWAYSIKILGQKLYVAFKEKLGNLQFYSALLYRLDFSDSDPANWFWEFVMQYPQLDHIMRLAVKDDILYLFGKDKTTDGLRIFTYNPAADGRQARRMENVVIREYPANTTVTTALPGEGSLHSDKK